MKTATATGLIKDFQKEVEEVADELNDQMEDVFDGPELDTINKERERVFDHLWSLEEQQTILGLLEGRKIKKKMKDLKYE